MTATKTFPVTIFPMHREICDYDQLKKAVREFVSGVSDLHASTMIGSGAYTNIWDTVACICKLFVCPDASV